MEMIVFCVPDGREEKFILCLAFCDIKMDSNTASAFIALTLYRSGTRAEVKKKRNSITEGRKEHIRSDHLFCMRRKTDELR